MKSASLIRFREASDRRREPGEIPGGAGFLPEPCRCGGTGEGSGRDAGIRLPG